MSEAKPVYGLPDVAVEDERSPVPGSVLLLLALVIGLFAAAVWLVALPAFDKTPPAEPSCEVYVLRSGATVCKPLLRPGAATPKPEPSSATR